MSSFNKFKQCKGKKWINQKNSKILKKTDIEGDIHEDVKKDVKDVCHEDIHEMSKKEIDKCEEKRLKRKAYERERYRIRKINPSFEITLSGKPIIVSDNEIRENIAILEEVFNDLIKKFPEICVETRKLPRLTQIFAVVNIIAKNNSQ
jgi:hypothetical protein